MTFNSPAGKQIEDILLEKHLLTDEQVSAIKYESQSTGVPTYQLIKERGYVSSLDYAKAYSEAFGIPFVDLEAVKPDVSLLSYVSLDLATKQGVVPFDFNKDTHELKVAMVDPLDLPTIEFIERRSNVKVVPYITTPESVKRVLGDFQGTRIGEEINAALEEIEQTTLKLDGNSEEISNAMLRDAPVARIVGMILETAVKIGASDIHIEPYEKDTRLRYRVDGILEEKRRFPKVMHDPIVARIKILANMKLDEKRKPQDGRFKVQVGDVSTDLRVSTLPTIYGEKVVIRLLQDEGKILSFKDLGLRGSALKRFEAALLKPTGIILVTGPTGSGKTVTLASALSKLNTSRVNIMTLEDPVEIRIPGVNQVQVNPQAGVTFASGLRSFLRQDPDVIMVGEIRDGETAELAIHAALTGHLVLATLHTNSAAGAIPRLLDQGVEDYLLASTINVVVAQRLVRRVCSACKEELEPPEEVQDAIRSILEPLNPAKLAATTRDKTMIDSLKRAQEPVITLTRGKGCDKCGNTGYHGRVGIFEVLPVSEAISDLILDHAPASKIHNQAVSEGMISLQQDGVLRVLEGITTFEEVMRVIK